MTVEKMHLVERTEIIAAEPVESLAGMFDIDVPFAVGSTVPPLWHWMYLLDRHPQKALGADGHARQGIPAPASAGQRRMFAGGRVVTHELLAIGREAIRTTKVLRSEQKVGKSGPLTFVTVQHEFHQDGRLKVVEEQDIVYREPGGATLPSLNTSPAPSPGPRLSLSVDEAMLFRFSALTYNAHRIHYDLSWTEHEGYDGLVVHGPLQALMMAEHMRREGFSLEGTRFAYRLVAPMVGPQTFTVFPGSLGLAAGAEVRSEAGVITAVSTRTVLEEGTKHDK